MNPPAIMNAYTAPLSRRWLASKVKQVTPPKQAGTSVGKGGKQGAEKVVHKEFTVQFGNTANQVSHTFRHTDVLGLDRTEYNLL